MPHSEIPFGSFLIYSPKGISDISKKSRTLCYGIKSDRHLTFGGVVKRAIPQVIAALKGQVDGGPLKDLFSEDTILVPVPGSAPLIQGGSHVSRVICEAMQRAGLGSGIHLLLRRESAVPKAAGSPSDKRPTIQQHYESMRVQHDLIHGSVHSNLLLVDDVVTRGTQFLACVSRLKEAFPAAQIKSLGIVRTMSGVEVETMVQPCTGTIRRIGDYGYRSP